jgi:hypothetical protein
MHNKKLINMAEGKLPFAVICVSVGIIIILLLTVLTVPASDLLMSLGLGASIIAPGLVFLGSWLVDRVKKRF